MATQATVVGDLRALLEALLEHQPNRAWSRSKQLNETIECSRLENLPDRAHILTMLCALVAEELRRTLDEA